MTRRTRHIVPARPTRQRRADAGYAMAVLLVGLVIMSVMLTVAMPVWHQMMQREKEEELIFRGTQYARAVGLFQRKYAGGFPPSVDVLVQQKFLRKKYKDPMVADGEFQLIPPGAMQAGQTGPSLPTTAASRPGQTSSFQASSGTSRPTQTGLGGLSAGVAGLIGVMSKSTDKSIRIYNGRDHYNEWVFVFTGSAGRGGAIGPGGRGQGPGGRGGRGGQGGPGGDIFGPPGPGGRGLGGFGPGQGGFAPPQFPPPGRGGRGGQ